MKKFIRMIAVAGALAAASGSAMAVDDEGAFFVNGNFGPSTYYDHGFKDNTDTSEAIRAGYSWQSYKVDFGVEGGYVDLGRATGEAYGVKYSARGKGPLAGLNLKYKFESKVFISARGGYFRSTLDEHVKGYGSDSFHGNGAYVGAGVGYDITPHFSLGLSFDDYHGRVSFDGDKASDDIGVYSGFAEYRF
jgi:hypothetical protein